ncbi:autophagy-related protein 13 [Nitzschia inconspicua]|uniref:Autophagy-related protein 13 n=1 Tax=Nitzschia inconspicua TaxID=303405 RepID=A0A9K3KAJ6_9STRA|nr:autophagy-related protein 13 [Nitzschia inconspicua]KAG7359441.1 autophagy-related protein 13 [Nitzschia inconspicua]
MTSSWENNHSPHSPTPTTTTSSPSFRNKDVINGGNHPTTNTHMMLFGQKQQQQQQHQQQSYFPSQQQQHQATTTTTTSSTSNATIETNGPRAKCDQVVFEAIAKAAEIVVGSRCWIDPTNRATQQQQQQQQQQQHQYQNLYSINNNNNNNSGNSGASSSSSSISASTSRFNLFVPEVQGVRSILQRWKRALHVPLRLDVYYQHSGGERELLERWCLEYAPSNGIGSHSSHNNNNNTGGGGPFTAATAFASPDPIVQLRQVCKNIVIWLRTLYCWSRMLPAQGLRKITLPTYLPNGSSPPIGFSIYVVSEGQDDVTSLISEKGFSSQGQPHCVPTPYGELGWKVFYAPKDVVLRLLPEPSPLHTNLVPRNSHYSNGTGGPVRQSQTQAIPMKVSRQQQPVPIPVANQVRHANTITAQSAPQHVGHRNLYRRASSDVSSLYHHDTVHDGHSQNHPAAGPRSYHHQRHHYLHQAHKSQSSGDMDSHHDGTQIPGQGQGGAGGGNNNNIVQPLSVASRMKDFEQPLKDGGSNSNYTRGLSSQSKNLSGLSLALMMSDEQSLSFNSADDTTSVKNGYNSTNKNETETNHDKNGDDTSNTDAITATEKRRAALHNAPPQFNASSPVGLSTSPMMKPTAAATTAGEYGYAYNNHIPTLQQYTTTRGRGQIGDAGSPGTPNTNNTSTAISIQGPQFPPVTSYSQSPSLRPMTPLGSTPPGYLLSATPSIGITGPFTPNSVGSGGLIPPARAAVTPPFVRPIGFVGEAPNQPLSEGTGNTPHGNQTGTTDGTSIHDSALQHHQTSLDLLHSSPFQHPPSQAYYSIHANSSFAASMYNNQQQQQQQHVMDHNNVESLSGAPFMNDYYLRSGSISDDIYGRGRSNSEAFLDHDLADDMPFAVDPISSSGTPGTPSNGIVSTNPGATTTHGSLASMMNEASLMASMCTIAPKRLAMFESKLVGDKGGSNSTPLKDYSGGSSGENTSNVMDSLADQLADFKSFGASLSVVAATNSSFAPEAPTASAGSG